MLECNVTDNNVLVNVKLLFVERLTLMSVPWDHDKMLLNVNLISFEYFIMEYMKITLGI